ncbi:GH18299 [Drosophila grimshawi]|uniref:GH18299 n=1 Tax=Drosophila grimshawi TaxID=7222 RepID=B4JFA6_DROGR|nr:GH18299 [Drosophila grimshawi]
MLAALILTALAFCIQVSAGLLNIDTPVNFACHNGDFISGLLKCNGERNCPDGSDELFSTCYDNICNYETQFRCNYGGCVDVAKKCNHVPDCWDKSDEIKLMCANDTEFAELLTKWRGNCTGELFKFHCKNTADHCLKLSAVCDGITNCPEGDDESVELCGGSICPEKTFRCESGACININDFCNHNIDCSDGSDELPEICINTRVEIDDKVWKSNSCQLPIKTGMQIIDYFEETSFMPGGQVPDKTVVAATCGNGYDDSGEAINKCDDGEWHNQWVGCFRQCDQSSHVRRVKFSTQCILDDGLVDCQGNTHIENTKLYVTCASGYKDSSGVTKGLHTCSENGTWSIEKQNPICEPICGITSPQHPDNIPWTVTIYHTPNSAGDYNFKCLGTIVSPYMVITTDMSEYEAYSYIIAEGKHTVNFNQDEDHGYVLHNVVYRRIISHEVNKVTYKAALFTVVKPFKFGALVRPICLIPNDAEAEDSMTPASICYA